VVSISGQCYRAERFPYLDRQPLRPGLRLRLGDGLPFGHRDGESVEPDEKPEFEIVDEVKADTVEIVHGGAALVQASKVIVTQAGAQHIEAAKVKLTQSGAGIIETETIDLHSSGAGLLIADNVELQESGIAVAFADTIKGDNSVIGVLLAGTIEGTPHVKLDLRRAAAFGAGAAVALFILRRIFR